MLFTVSVPLVRNEFPRVMGSGVLIPPYVSVNPPGEFLPVGFYASIFLSCYQI